MKQKLFLVLMALLFMPATRAVADYAMQVHLKDGTKQTFLMTDCPGFTVSDGLLSIKTTSVEFSCELSQVDYYDFPSDIDPMGIESIRSAEGIRLDGGLLVLSGLKGNAEVAVYTIDGTKAMEVAADSRGDAVISLSLLPKGVCIVKAGNVSTKITNK